MGDVIWELSAQWKALSTANRQPFLAGEEGDWRRYDEECLRTGTEAPAAWEALFPTQGRHYMLGPGGLRQGGGDGGDGVRGDVPRGRRAARQHTGSRGKSRSAVWDQATLQAEQQRPR